ncbi:hypothetical protein LguiB_035569 [Lonicera macranthoides]
MASLRFLLRSPSSILSPPIPISISISISISIPIPTLYFVINPRHVPSPKPLSTKKTLSFKPLTISHALAESNSPKSLEPDPQSFLQELADTFNLPDDFLAQLPSDLRLDLNDAAFDLSNGQVIDECGQELGDTLLDIARAWERADTSTSTALVSRLPSLVDSSTDYNKSALGKRLVSAGRRFQSMGQYGQGEVQKIAKAMITTGKLLSANQVSKPINEEPSPETRMLKFGELQVELTPKKAYVGAVIASVFGILSWQISQGIQSMPENSLQYANDNALLLAKSLRGALIALFYSSTFLSAMSTVGLVLLGGQLKSTKEK